MHNEKITEYQFFRSYVAVRKRLWGRQTDASLSPQICCHLENAK